MLTRRFEAEYCLKSKHISTDRVVNSTVFLIDLLRAGHKPGTGELNIERDGTAHFVIPTPDAFVAPASSVALCSDRHSNKAGGH